MWYIVSILGICTFFLTLAIYDKAEMSRAKYAYKIAKVVGIEHFIWIYIQSFGIQGVKLKYNRDYSLILDVQIQRNLQMALDGINDYFLSHDDNVRISLSDIDERTINYESSFDPYTHSVGNMNYHLSPKTHRMMEKLYKRVVDRNSLKKLERRDEGY